MSYILGGLLEGLGQATQGYAENIQETQQKKDLMKEQFGYDKQLAQAKSQNPLDMILAGLAAQMVPDALKGKNASVNTNDLSPQDDSLEEIVGPNGQRYFMSADGIKYDAEGNQVQ